MALQDGGSELANPAARGDAATARDHASEVAGRTVSSDPEGTGATLTASKSQVCPGECVELLASPGSERGAVSYRWANELAEGAGPVRVCPQVDTTYEVSIRHERGTVGEFSAVESEVSRSVTVQVAGDCQVEAQPPEIHESAREICRARVALDDLSGLSSGEYPSRGLLLGPRESGPSLVRFLPSGGMRLAGTHRGRLTAGPFSFEAYAPAGFVIDLDAACQPISAAQFAPQQDDGELRLTGLAVDTQGNSVVMGLAQGFYDLGNGVLREAQASAGSAGGAVLAKLDPHGRALWSKVLPDVYELGNLRLDGHDNIVLVALASSFGAVDFGGGAVQFREGDALLAKFDRDGNALWIKPFEVGGRFDVAPDGHFATSGIRLRGDTGDPGLMAATTVALFDANANELWRREQTVSDAARVHGAAVSVAVTADHRVALRAEYFPALGDQSLNGSSSVLIASYDRDGELLWRHQAAVSSYDPGILDPKAGLTLDRRGTMATVGAYMMPRDPAAAPAAGRTGDEEVYVDLFDRSGRQAWHFPLRNGGRSQLIGVDSDGAGHLAIAAAVVPDLPTSALVVVKLAQ